MMPAAQLRQPIAHARVSAPEAGRRRPRCVVACAAGDKDSKDAMDSLAERIASGQYSQSGSKKEKLTRPARKLLSKDRIGPGNVAWTARCAESLVQTVVARWT